MVPRVLTELVVSSTPLCVSVRPASVMSPCWAKITPLLRTLPRVFPMIGRDLDAARGRGRVALGAETAAQNETVAGCEQVWPFGVDMLPAFSTSLPIIST